VRDAAKTIRVRGGTAPRVIARKAGLAAPEALSDVMRRGLEREPELAEAWRAQLHGSATLLEPESLRYVPHAVPRAWLPLVDRHCHELTCTPDAWIDDVLGGHHVVELKCSVRAHVELPPHYVLQVQAQIAVTGADGGVLVVGQQWGAGWLGDGPIATWTIRRDERLIDELRAAAHEGWQRVLALRGAEQ
jgi:hypothetical protein